MKHRNYHNVSWLNVWKMTETSVFLRLMIKSKVCFMLFTINLQTAVVLLSDNAQERNDKWMFF